MKKTYLLMGSFFILLVFSSHGYPYIFSAEKEVFQIEVVERLILLEAQVNEEYGYFLFDTGAPQLVLNKKYYKSEQGSEIAQSIVDVNGISTLTKQIFVNAFQLGSLKRKKFWAAHVNLIDLEEKLNKKVLGLIGIEVIEDLEVLIDYYQSSLTLIKLDAKGNTLVEYQNEPDYQFPFKLGHYLPVLEVSFVNNLTINLGLDTGSTLNLIDKGWQSRLDSITTKKRKISFKGILSTVKQADYWLMRDVIIGDQIAWKYWKAAFSDFSHLQKYKVPVDGILGINFLRMGKVAFNYRKKSIQVWSEVNGYEGMYYVVGRGGA